MKVFLHVRKNLDNWNIQISFSPIWLVYGSCIEHSASTFSSAPRGDGVITRTFCCTRTESPICIQTAPASTLININFFTMDFVATRAWDSSCLVICLTRLIAVKFMLRFPRLRCWRCLVRTIRMRLLSPLRRSVEELDVRDTLNLTTIRVRKFSLLSRIRILYQ